MSSRTLNTHASKDGVQLHLERSELGYRDVILDLSQQNFSRALRVSNKQLAEQLDAVIVVLRRSLKIHSAWKRS